ncbi:MULTISPECIES: pyruvate kinase [unclassified Paenibacillus]|uniref:pyruvate kinase n=1 Tax=unclassified Paenibacillus TaxID=185978 RepID=UPI001AE33E23|nr:MULTISPECIES: pyruvate kinase [unclassified Paenibacillus]MBP1154604.1 pyruvate kinase [Paenibacillus sp. PvP091]MBP1170012.1 pyruvate kinase [Paenibacillus sp. PvR098]MBP2441040.1 pyruvate kinase [Paenibacillus sp. PvP052]
MRKTKIVCTIGPVSESLDMFKKLIDAGMNVARLNFSHGDFEEHGNRIKTVRQASQEMGKSIAILLDTKGPEIRTGKLKDDQKVELIQDNLITLTTEEVLGDAERVSITYRDLYKDVRIGSTILIDDGLIGLSVEDIRGTDIVCRIKNGGLLGGKKGVNVPGVKINLPGITEKDANDIIFGIQQGVDFIAASFVRKASDVIEIREILERYNAAQIQIISKIENQEGVDNLDEILEVSDGLMVARGDLGVEIPAEDVPIVQKAMIKKCNQVGKPVITATMMLDSMQRNPRPTRAEASDVANAIFDGSDAVMLSGETAAGKYPIESVQTMARIAERAEQAMEHREILVRQSKAQQTTVTEAISQSVANSALELDAKAILTATESGYTARMVSKYRPKAPIIAVTPDERVLRRLSLVWGVVPVKGESCSSTDQLFEHAVDSSVKTGLVSLGDLVIITAGVPVGRSGTTNLIKVHQIGEMIAKGQGIGTQIATGKVVTARSPEEALAKATEGCILVTPTTDKEYMPAFQKAAAVITETGGITSHAAVVGISLGKPVIVGVVNALNILKDDAEVSIYPEVGVIYSGRARVL